MIRDAAGRFFASFVVEVDEEPLPETGRECGIDLGLGHFAVLDDGTKVTAPRFLRRAEKKLKKAQRELARKQKDSKNRENARLKVARAHAKVADARRDFHHKLSTMIVRENQAVTVEDLSVKGLLLLSSLHEDAQLAGFGLPGRRAAARLSAVIGGLLVPHIIGSPVATAREWRIWFVCCIVMMLLFIPLRR